MLGSVRFLPRPRMLQNLNFGLRGISSLVSAPPPLHLPTITSKSTAFYYLFLVFTLALLSLPCASFLGTTHLPLLIIPPLFILSFSLLSRRRFNSFSDLIRFQLGRFQSKKNGSGSKKQSLKKWKGCKGMKETLTTEREKDKEEEVIIITELRRQLKRERKRAKEATEELEREREASAWASQEAMSKIMLLESEKALVQREARQYREIMEQKQLHDQEVFDYYLHLLLHNNNISDQEKAGVSRSVSYEDDEIWTLRSAVL